MKTETRLNEILSKRFEAEECAPPEKEVRYQEYRAILEKAAQETNRPIDKIETAILTRYWDYKRKRLINELPNVPPALRRT